MQRTIPYLLVLLLLGVGCGGGGGEEEPETCEPAGDVRALAVAGQPAPGTAGSFGAIPMATPKDVAEGGWAVFAAPTTDATMAEVLYVALPDRTLLTVWAAGDEVPDAAGGQVATFLGAWVSPAGEILTLVTIAGDGDGRGLGLLSARVEGGAVVSRHDVVYQGRSLVPVDLTGNLDAIDPLRTYLTTDGHVVFRAVTTTGDEGLLRVSLDGTSVFGLLVGTGMALPSGQTAGTIGAVGLGPSSDYYAFVTVRQSDGNPGLYVGRTGIPGHGIVMELGDALLTGQVETLPDTQFLAVDGGGRLLFKAVSDTAHDHLCFGGAFIDTLFLAVEGEVDPNSGGLFGALDWLHQEPGISVPLYQAQLGANEAGVGFVIYGVLSPGEDPVVAMFETRPAPVAFGEGVVFSSIFPGIRGATDLDVSADNALAFCNVLSDGRAGLWWLLPNCGLFTVAAGELPTPDGADVFDRAAAWAATTSIGVILFRAPLVTAGSGIFLRGP